MCVLSLLSSFHCFCRKIGCFIIVPLKKMFYCFWLVSFYTNCFYSFFLSYFTMMCLAVAFFVFTHLGFVALFESVALCNLSVCKSSDYFLFKYCLCYIICHLFFQDSNYMDVYIGPHISLRLFSVFPKYFILLSW